MGSLTQGFQLDGLQVAPLTGEISGPGGIARLDPKAMDVLVLMAEHPGEVMLREDLLSRLWGRVVVTDDALTRYFYELRRHLSHAGGDKRYRELIETLPKRGYRLNATVQPGLPSATPAVAADPAPQRRGFVLAAVAMGLVAAAAAAVLYWKSPEPAQVSATAATTHSIAVLPFLDMSESKDQRYLADGVTEEILNHLAQAKNLRVISRTSTFALRDTSLGIPQIGDRLGVDYVLEGSLRRSGTQLRITAQLINVATNSHAWSQTYDRTLDDLFRVQDEIAASVARELQVELAGGARSGGTPANAIAYERYLQGQFHYHRRATGDIQRAIDYYEEAVESAPEFARAWAALAGAYSLAIGELPGKSDARLLEMQGRAAHRAVELEPQLAVAHVRLGQYYYHEQQYDEGDEQMRIAATLDPDDPLVLGFTASDALWNGDLRGALELWRKAVALDPLSPTVRGNYAYFLLANDRFEESLAEHRRVLELNPGAGPEVESEIARILILLGRDAEATAVIARIPEGNWRDYPLALMHRGPERLNGADAALERLAARADDTIDRVHLAEAFAYRGRRDEALDTLLEFRRQLDPGRETRSRDWWEFQEEIRMAALLKPLHDDPRWAVLTALPDDF